MKFCQPHWDKLRVAIDARGLTKHVSPSGEDAAARLRKQLEAGAMGAKAIDSALRESFDPLMAAHNAITYNAVETRGLAVLQNEGCPLCFLNEQHKRDFGSDGTFFEEWIDKAADEQLNLARKLGLVGVA